MLSCRREFSFLEPAKVVTRVFPHGLGHWLDNLEMFCAGGIFRGHRHQATCLQEIRGVGVWSELLLALRRF